MNINLSQIKNKLIITIDYIKKSLSLGNLNARESQGFVSLLTKIRFMPYTSVVVPFYLGRSVRGLSFSENIMLDPYGKLCTDIVNNVDLKEIYSDLMIVFKKEKDLSAADIVHLRNNNKLREYPAWAIVMPWEKLSIQEQFEFYLDSFYKNRSTNDLTFETRSRSSIIKTMYSLESSVSQVNQMSKLYKSVKQFGIKKTSDLPKINILINSNEWRWFMGDAGNHRSFVCSCLDIEVFEARISSIIYKNEVNSWPNVINGTYSQDEAEQIFDSYFDGANSLRGSV